MLSRNTRLVLTATLACVAALTSNLSSATTKKAAKPAPAASVPAATPEQHFAAENVHTGRIECELGQSIHVSKHPKHAGYVDVKVGNVTYLTKPSYAESGALRLDDTKKGMFMVQLADSSMVFNTRTGQRAAAQCRHPKQQEFFDSLPK